jgi:hypothetical protein
MRSVVFGVVLIASLLACGGSSSSTRSRQAPSTAANRAMGRAGGSHGPRSASVVGGGGPIVAEYNVTYDGRGELSVEARLTKPGDVFTVESGAEPFVKDFEVAAASSTTDEASPKWKAGTRGGDQSFVAAACASGNGSCRIRYRFALRAASKKIGDLDVASEEGEVIEAPPSTWLLSPSKAADPNGRLRFRVTTTPNTTFATGVFRARDSGDKELPQTWDIALSDLWTAPYSVFGPLRSRTVMTDGDRTKIEMAIAPGPLTLTDDELASWTSDCARAIVTYFGRFPMSEALVILVPSRGRWVGEGKTLSGGGGAIFMRVGERAPIRALRDDWVLVHEMTHLTFPSVPRGHDWAEEGLATYVEPFARARAGILSVEDAWKSLVEGLPNGLPQNGDRGLDHTPTWGRTYWGGALFYLLADIEIRKRTNNRFGLEHALRGILDAGGNNAHRWALEDAFAAGDKATGVPALHDLHEAMGSSPHPVDLPALWRELGISMQARGTSVKLDDTAPLAAIRRAITTAN